jgi:hypothetical protein
MWVKCVGIWWILQRSVLHICAKIQLNRDPVAQDHLQFGLFSSIILDSSPPGYWHFEYYMSKVASWATNLYYKEPSWQLLHNCKVLSLVCHYQVLTPKDCVYQLMYIFLFGQHYKVCVYTYTVQLLHLNEINMRFYGAEFNIVVLCSIKPHIDQVQV